MIDNSTYRYGSAGFATTQDMKRVGLFEQHDNSFLFGFDGERPLFSNSPGGKLICAGARTGKLATILAYNLFAGICSTTQIILDMKGELAAISQDQTADRKHCIYWNPLGLHGLPSHRINPVDYIDINSPSLVSDVKAFAENRIPNTSPNSAYFEGRARQFCEAFALTLAELNGILTLPDLYEVVNYLPGGGDQWLNFAYAMSTSRFQVARAVEEEIATSRENSGNGFQGIVGELMKSFASLSDPRLRESMSPPYDFSYSQLTSTSQLYNVYHMPPAEFVAGWAPEIRSHYVAGMIYKSRAPHAPQQTWIIDEVAQLNRFPLAVKMFTYGAGIGCRPVLVFQSTKQMNALGDNAENIMKSSAACQIYFGVRDLETATTLSRMCGAQTLDYYDEHTQLRLEQSKQQAVHSLLMGGDPIAAGFQLKQAQKAMETPQKQQRLLRTPDEILNMPEDAQITFIDGLDKPILSKRKRYFEQRNMAGKYHPNPYHPPTDKVRVKTRFGHEWRRVIETAVPPEFADYPQYQNRNYSYVEK